MSPKRSSKSGMLYLVRHGHSTANSRNILAGRDNKVVLPERGQREAKLLAETLSGVTFSRIYSSPLTRCLQTLQPLSDQTGLEVNQTQDLIEMDYGKWSGEKIPSLSRKSLWKVIQETPSQVRFPGGESFMEMSTRVTEALINLAIPGKSILICTHGDVIKSAITTFMGSHLDNLQRISVDPASISILAIGKKTQVVQVNQVTHLGTSDKRSANPTLGGGAGGNHK